MSNLVKRHMLKSQFARKDTPYIIWFDIAQTQVPTNLEVKHNTSEGMGPLLGRDLGRSMIRHGADRNQYQYTEGGFTSDVCREEIKKGLDQCSLSVGLSCGGMKQSRIGANSTGYQELWSLF